LAFRGHYEHTLDSKDRLTVPARFRATLAEGVVLSAGLDPCVEVYSPEGFERHAGRLLEKVNPLGAKGRLLHRSVYSRSFDERLDASGRVRLPRQLIEHAGFEGGCVVVGMNDHLEIWDARRWSEYETEMNESVGDVAEGFAEPAEPT